MRRRAGQFHHRRLVKLEYARGKPLPAAPELQRLSRNLRVTALRRCDFQSEIGSRQAAVPRAIDQSYYLREIDTFEDIKLLYSLAEPRSYWLSLLFHFDLNWHQIGL